LIFAIFATLFTFCAKKKVVEATSILGLDYYPTQVGKFVVYDIDSTVYDELSQTSKLYKYRIKEKLTENFTDNEGKPAIRIERYIKVYNPLKSYDSIPYVIKEVWMANADDKKIQVVENNLRYTKLIFPIKESTSWNGNANNTLGELNYSYSYIDKTEVVNGNSLTNVLFVIQRDDKTLIAQQYYTEKYAKGVGLVYREIKDIYSNNVVAGVPIEQRIEKGVIYKQILVNYGYE